MSEEDHLGGRVRLFNGDSRDVLKSLPDASIDSVVTDPPYALVSIVKRFGGENAAPARVGDVYARASAGFMGKTWDTGETAFAIEFWAEVMRVLKPGGWLVAASGTRTYHRLAVAIEDAGFEVRDMISWLYGSGFPKSHDVAKGIDRHFGAERPVVGRETLSNDIRGGALLDVAHGADRPAFERDITAAATPQAAAWQGWGTALKPACEPWVLARKPLISTVAANVLEHGTGAINIDGCRIGDGECRPTSSGSMARKANPVYGAFANTEVEALTTTLGRWPANIILDSSDEVEAAFGESFRFFYSAKADALDRIGSKHPTVKPVDLMQYLCRLITPPGGTVLDPFAGSGTTGEAAWREGFNCILIEREAEYASDIRERLRLCTAGEKSKRRAIAAKKAPADASIGGIFGDGAAPPPRGAAIVSSTANSQGTDNRASWTAEVNE